MLYSCSDSLHCVLESSSTEEAKVIRRLTSCISLLSESKFCSAFYPMSESHRCVYSPPPPSYMVVYYKKTNPVPTTLAAPSHFELNHVPALASKTLCPSAPAYLSDFLKYPSPLYPAVYSTLASFLLRRHISFFLSRGLCTAVPPVWEALPSELCVTVSCLSFKTIHFQVFT